MPEACRTVSVKCRHGLLSLVVILEVALVYLITRVGLLEERPVVSGVREETQREEWQCQVEDDTAERPVAKTEKVLLVTNLGQCDDRLTARVCPFRVIDKGESETMISILT